jgi:hypothetical protein
VVMRKGGLPLIGVHQSHPSFFEAALEARRAIASATTDASLNDAASRMVVQLHGLGECIANMAETGLVHVDITASGLQTQTRQVDGQWVSQTRVLRLPPRMCSEVKLPPNICNAVMQSLVILNALELDTQRELVEIREMAAMVASDWPGLDDSAAGKALEASMRAAWRNAPTDSPTDSTNRLARALTERLRGAVRAIGTGDAVEGDGIDTALEYARRTLLSVSQ